MLVILYSGWFIEDAPLLKCPLHYCTGLYCPGCGSQRAIISIFSGDLGAAFWYNIMLIPGLILCGFMVITKKKTWALHKNNYFIFGIAVFIILFGILRNIPVHPFNLLAP